MSRVSSSPRAVAPKRPTLRIRKSPTLPPFAPPARPARHSLSNSSEPECPEEELESEAVPPTVVRNTLPPMPLVPMLGARDSDAWLDETEIRPADLDTSVAGITEVKSALAFKRSGHIPASELFEATTNRMDRRALLRQAALMPVGEDTAPTLQANPGSLNHTAHARATMQVSPHDLERVRRLSQTLERDSVPVLQLVDSVRLSQDDLLDDEEEPETLSELGDSAVLSQVSVSQVSQVSQPGPPPARRPEVSDPGLQGFHGNEDWGLVPGKSVSDEVHIKDAGRPLVSAVTGETPWLGDVRQVVSFADEDEPLPPVDVSFADDLSLVPDLRPESMEVRAVAMAPMIPMANVAVITASGFAPLNPTTKLRTPNQAFVPHLSTHPSFAVQNIPVQSGQAHGMPLGMPGQPFAVHGHQYLQPVGLPPSQDSGQVSLSSDVGSGAKGGWTAPLLFVAVLLAAVCGGYFVLGPRTSAPAPAVAAPVALAPVATAAPSAAPVVPAPAAPVVTAAPVATALSTLPVVQAPEKKPAPVKAAPKAAPKKAPKPAAKAPAEDDGPKPLATPAAPAAEPSVPSVQGLGDLLNGAL